MTLSPLSCIAAPRCLFAYGTIRLIGLRLGGYGPGIAWNSGHIVAALCFLLFIVVVLGIRQQLPGQPEITAITVAIFAGLAAILVRFGVDIVAGIGALPAQNSRSTSRCCSTSDSGVW